MQKLLDRLKKLDPETYRRFREICATTMFDYSPLDDPDIDTPVYGWCLQGVIQDAITARKWSWKVFRSQLHKDGYVAQVGVKMAKGDTPVEAILAAYVAALEVQD